MAASLNEIYGRLGELTGGVKAINEKVDSLGERLTASERVSAESRANMHRRLDDLVLRTTHLESDMSATKGTIDKMEQVTVEVTTLRTKAEGAGTLGRWLIRLGIGIVTLAGWMVGVYTYITGRPPP